MTGALLAIRTVRGDVRGGWSSRGQGVGVVALVGHSLPFPGCRGRGLGREPGWELFVDSLAGLFGFARSGALGGATTLVVFRAEIATVLVGSTVCDVGD